MNWKRKTCNLHLHVIPHVYVITLHILSHTLTQLTRIFIFEGGGGFLEEEEEEEEEEDIEYRLPVP